MRKKTKKCVRFTHFFYMRNFDKLLGMLSKSFFFYDNFRKPPVERRESFRAARQTFPRRVHSANVFNFINVLVNM